MTHTTIFRSAVLAVLSLTVSFAAGCGAAPIDGEDPATSSEAYAPNELCDVGSLGSSRCQAWLADINAQTSAVGREHILERAEGWLEAGVIYDRGGNYQGWRPDCSGFVGMAWENRADPSTAFYPPGKYDNGFAVPLGGLDDLVPGDALNRNHWDPLGHIMLFAGWADAEHQVAYLIHHYKPGKPVGLIIKKRSDLGDYVPIRSTQASAPTNAPTDTTMEPPPPPQVPTDGCGVLQPGQQLDVNVGVTSCDGRFTLIQQGDGNLVLYQAGGFALWSSRTDGTPGRVAIMQGDGNFVVYTPEGTPVWNAGTFGHDGAFLRVQDDGNVVISGGGALWATGTSGH